MKIAKIFKTIWKNVRIFLAGAVIGFIINTAFIFPSAIQKVASEKDVGLGIIALPPALFLIYGIISVAIGGFLAIVIYNIVRRLSKKRNR